MKKTVNAATNSRLSLRIRGVLLLIGTLVFLATNIFSIVLAKFDYFARSGPVKDIAGYLF